MKRIMCFVFTMIMLIVSMTNIPPVETKGSSGNYKRVDFVRNLANELINCKSLKEGGTLSLRLNDKGKVISVNGKKIKNKTVKKYAEKYGMSKNDARQFLICYLLGVIGKSDFKKANKSITVKEASGIMVKADKLLYGTEVSSDDIEFVTQNRISDVKKEKGEYKEYLATAYILGFFEGKAEIYSHKRELSPGSKLTASSGNKLIQRLVSKEKRVPLSEDFQVIRTENLPHNAEYYSYILDSFPDEYYDTGFNGITKNFFDKGTGLGADTLSERMQRKSFGFVYPFETKEFNKLRYPGPEFSYSSDVFLDCYRNNESMLTLSESSVEFYEYALNVDYRTIKNDTEWKKIMGKYLSEDEIDDYIKHCIENKTVIESDLVAADVSSVYWYNGDYNCKVYAHVRIVSDDPLKEGLTTGADQEKVGYLYPVRRGYEPGTLFTRSVLGTNYMNYRMGEWVDLFFNTNGLSDSYGCLNCSNTSRGIMIDYTGLMPWLLKYPY